MVEQTKRIEQLKGELKTLNSKVRILEEQNLQLSSENVQFFRLFDTSHEGVRIIDTHYNITHANQSFLNMVGKTKVETIGEKCFIICPSSRCHSKKCPIRIIKKDNNKNLAYHIYHKNAENIDIPYRLSTRALLDSENNFNGIIETYADISEQLKSESEQHKLLTALEQSNTMIAITNSEGKIEYVNSKFCNTTGYNFDELKDRNLEFFNHLSDASDLQEKLWNTLSQGKTWSGELYCKTKNGEFFWESASISPVYNSNKKLTNYIKVAVDITEKKKIEKKLEKSEKQLKNILENSPRMFYTHTVDHTLTYISPQIKNILGYTPAEGQQNWKNTLSDNPINEKAIKVTQKAIDTGKKQSPYELELVKKSGEKIFVEATEFPIVKNGKTVEIVGSLSDITERKKAENIQRVIFNISNAVITTLNIEDFIKTIKIELNTIIDTTNFYIAIYDRKTDTFNLPFHIDKKDNLTNFPAHKTLTSYVIKIKKPLLATPNIIQELEKMGEIKLIGNDSKIWLGVPLMSKDTAFGVLTVQSYDNEKAYDKNDMKVLEIISRTISIALERKKIISDLKQALDKAKESDRLKSAFLSNMSHEIRTPLNGIMGFIQLLNDPFYGEKEKKGFSKIIKRGSIRLLNTINDMIDISKIEAGQMHISLTKTSVNNLLIELYEFFKPETDSKDIELSYISEISEKESVILTDNDKLHAILRNLIKNAIKYTDKGTIRFGCRINEDVLEIYVRDTGIGVPENRINAIFNRFEQADIEDKRAFEGSGLGLAITKSYVKMLNGEIKVESVVGEGSEFTLILPYKRPNMISL